jgi:hypothetical protein
MPHQKRPTALATRGLTSALRIARTVVEIHSQHPTTSPLLSDGVRVLSRTLAKAKRGLQVVSALAHHVLRDRTRAAVQHAPRGGAVIKARTPQTRQKLAGPASDELTHPSDDSRRWKAS